MKATIISDTSELLTVKMDRDASEEEARQVIGIDGTYHKRANCLWIVVKH